MPGKIRVRHVDRLRDKFVVHENDHYVCIMKLFPTCDLTEQIGEEDWRRFHLRFYFPKECIVNAHKKVDKLVVMTNGLDEINYYTLYDELGSRFASQGLAAVLLPLPDHLNRHTRYRIKKPSVKQIYEKPSQIMMEDPLKLYLRYIQFRDELLNLVNHVVGRSNCANKDDVCSFFKVFFSPKTRVSFLGFSLGGAAMLGNFLEWCKDDSCLNSCVLLSGAINLSSITPEPLFDAKIWDEYVAALEEVYREKTKYEKEEYDSANKRFGQVLFGHGKEELRNLLQSFGRRILFMFGGRDNVISYQHLEEISPRKWGLGFLVLPGINHFLPIDEEWWKWIGLVTNMIVDYEENADRQVITRQKVCDNTEVLRNKLDCKEKVMEATCIMERAPFIGLDPVEMDYAEEEKKTAGKYKYGGVISALEKFSSKNGTLNKKDQKTCLSAMRGIRLGQCLYVTQLIDIEDLCNAVRIKQENKRKAQNERIGDILVDRLKVVKREHVEIVADCIDFARTLT